MKPPSTVLLTIEHNEPALKYSGTVTPTTEDAPTKFEFNGAIDGKEYPAKEGSSERGMKFTRKSDRVIESDATLSDGSEEHSILTLSGDGRTLERRMRVRTRDGARREWTEIYEKRR